MREDRPDGDTTTFNDAFRRRDDRYVEMLKEAGGFKSVELPAKTGPHARVPIAVPAVRAATLDQVRQPVHATIVNGRMLRPVTPLQVGPAFRRGEVSAPPRIAWLPLSQLVIDETYQRGLGSASLALIRRLARTWDWNRFKPLSVAPTDDGRYEVVDGQHSAIAAATNGAIELLPCLVLTAATTAAKSAAFVGINNDRLRLTPYALFRARVAAGDDKIANEVVIALRESGAQLVESLRAGKDDYPVGTTPCVSKLLGVARDHGGELLCRVLSVAVRADTQIVNSTVVEAITRCLTRDVPIDDAVLVTALKRLGWGALTTKANLTWRTGAAANINTAAEQVLMAQVG